MAAPPRVVATGVFSPFATVVASTELVTTGLLTIPGFTDDPTLPNLVFKYNGPDFDASGGPFPPIDFNGLSAKSIFGGLQDHKINGGDDVLSIGYTELIAPLIKAIQELTARVVELESR